VFLKEFILGFGFFGGLFTRTGIDPEMNVIGTLPLPKKN